MTRIPLMRIGCSGWNYASWKGSFYPADVAATRWLRFYAEMFDTVEVNGTFYRLPEASTFAAWREQTSDAFLMSVKASRFLTHMKRLRDPEEPLARLFSRASHLGDRLGPVLYQLPASFHRDLTRLDALLGRAAGRAAAGGPRGVRVFQQRPRRRGDTEGARIAVARRSAARNLVRAIPPTTMVVRPRAGRR